MAIQEIIYKIQDTATGLYSGGGYNPSWTPAGKSWKTLAQLKASLKLYKRGQYAGEKRTIPSTWTVVEMKLVAVSRTRAHLILK